MNLHPYGLTRKSQKIENQAMARKSNRFLLICLELPFPFQELCHWKYKCMLKKDFLFLEGIFVFWKLEKYGLCNLGAVMIGAFVELCVCSILLPIILTLRRAYCWWSFWAVIDNHALPLFTANYETAEGVSLPRSTLYTHYLKHCNESR